MGIPLRRARAKPSARFGFRARRGAQELLFREGVAGRKVPHGWEAENARYYRRLQRGKGGAPFPQRFIRHPSNR
jgi:hypothetical protein